MGWEERFRKLPDLEQRQAAESEQKRKREIAEFQRIYELYGPKLEKICMGFAKAVGFKYEAPTKKEILKDLIPNLFSIRFTARHYGCGSSEYSITLQPDTIFISGKVYSGGEYWGGRWVLQKTIPIPFNEFTEEKVAQLFEDLFKEVLQKSG